METGSAIFTWKRIAGLAGQELQLSLLDLHVLSPFPATMCICLFSCFCASDVESIGCCSLHCCMSTI